ncbi:MAG: hypothetical protein ACM3JH_06585 [Acidithiobacillales bacterium]
MTPLSLVLPVLSLLVLGAHFFRSAEYAIVALCIALVALVSVRRWWAARALQAALFLGAAEWLRTMTGLVHLRRSLDLPWARLAVILGAVALLTVVSALMFETARLRERYGLSRLKPGS